MDENLISVIVPVYNVEEYLDRCMKSIVNQTYRNLEILLIDDGSTDNSGKLCDEWEKKDNRIKVIHKENGGVSSARNIGLEQAKGEFIGFVDSDDYIHSQMYEILYQGIKKEKIDFALCDFKQIEQYEDEQKNIEKVYQVNTKFQTFQYFYPISGESVRCLFKKEILKDVRFDEKMYISEDLNFVCKYILNCENNSVFIDNKLYYYVKRKGSITNERENKEKRLHMIEDVLEVTLTTQKMIMENCDDVNVIRMLQTRTIYYYWNNIYSLLNEKLVTNDKLIKRYYTELQAYKRYFSLKDKIYIFLVKVNPKLFEFAYKKGKKIKRLRRN